MAFAARRGKWIVRLSLMAATNPRPGLISDG